MARDDGVEQREALLGGHRREVAPVLLGRAPARVGVEHQRAQQLEPRSARAVLARRARRARASARAVRGSRAAAGRSPRRRRRSPGGRTRCRRPACPRARRRSAPASGSSSRAARAPSPASRRAVWRRRRSWPVGSSARLPAPSPSGMCSSASPTSASACSSESSMRGRAASLVQRPAGGQIGLRVEVDHQDRVPEVGETRGEVGARQRLADAALLAQHGDRDHRRSLRAGGVLRGTLRVRAAVPAAVADRRPAVNETSAGMRGPRLFEGPPGEHAAVVGLAAEQAPGTVRVAGDLSRRRMPGAS